MHSKRRGMHVRREDLRFDCHCSDGMHPQKCGEFGKSEEHGKFSQPIRMYNCSLNMQRRCYQRIQYIRSAHLVDVSLSRECAPVHQSLHYRTGMDVLSVLHTSIPCQLHSPPTVPGCKLANVILHHRLESKKYNFPICVLPFQLLCFFFKKRSCFVHKFVIWAYLYLSVRRFSLIQHYILQERVGGQGSS